MKRLALIPVLLLATLAVAQINGVPASVTSTNGNYSATWNPPASVTSLGRNGYSVPPCSGIGLSPLSPPCVIGGQAPFRHHGHRGHGQGYGYAYPFYPSYVPYEYSDYEQPAPPPQPVIVEVEPAGPAPTVFDRNGSGYASVSSAPAQPEPARAAAQPSAPPPPAEEQETVTLVFRDGKKLDITNYAVMGATLFDLTPGHLKRKIALSDLDIPATIKLNDERGVDFQLPKSAA